MRATRVLSPARSRAWNPSPRKTLYSKGNRGLAETICRHISQAPDDERDAHEGIPVTPVHRDDLRPCGLRGLGRPDRDDQRGRIPRALRLEERFGPFLRRYRLPLPRFNDWIVLGPKRFQVDCHWPQLHLIAELDGWEGHPTRSAFQDDRARDRALHAAGISVIHLTWNQLEVEAEAVASDLRRLLAEVEK